MRNRDATAVVAYPTQSMIIASVATTQNLIVISYGDGRTEHGAYPPNGRFHVTFEGERDSRHSFVTPGPAYSELTYYPLARVDVPPDPTGFTRPYGGSGQTMTIEPRGTLEISVLGRRATPEVIQQLRNDGASVQTFGGPRSDTTIVFRYLT